MEPSRQQRLRHLLVALPAISAYLCVGIAVEGAHNHGAMAGAAGQAEAKALVRATGSPAAAGECLACLYIQNSQSICRLVKSFQLAWGSGLRPWVPAGRRETTLQPTR